MAWCPACASLLQGRPRRVIPPMAESEFIDSAAPAEPGPPSAAAAHGGAMELGLPPAYALARYRGPVRAAILAAKEHGRRDLPAVLGAALGRGLVRLLNIAVIIGPVWLVPAPTRPAMARQRGGDPMTWMARAAALELVRCGYPAGVSPCLFTGRGARDSVGLSAADRIDNLAGRIRWRSRAAPPPRAPVVILDDVLTTGATATAAAQVLRQRMHSVQAVLTLATVPAMVSS